MKFREMKGQHTYRSNLCHTYRIALSAQAINEHRSFVDRSFVDIHDR
jgi:hypothetical protein